MRQFNTLSTWPNAVFTFLVTSYDVSTTNTNNTVFASRLYAVDVITVFLCVVCCDHRCFEQCVLSQCSTVRPCGPEGNWIVIWKVPVPVAPCERTVPHGSVHISGDCWDLLPWVVSTVGDGGCDKALLHFVAAGPSLHRSELCWLH